MKYVVQNFKGRYREIILGPLFKLLEAILELLVPLVMANIIDVGIKNGDTAYILRNGLLMVLLGVLGIISALICQYYAALAGGHFGKNLRGQLYRHIMKFSEQETARFGSGALITRLTNDTNQIQAGVNMAIRLGSRVPFLAVGSIVMAIALNWKIGLVFLVSTPLIAVALYFIMKRTVHHYQEIQAGQDRLSQLAGENLEGARVIRGFSRQQQEKQEFEQAAGSLTDLTVRVGKISATLNPLTNVIVNIAIVAIVWLGADFAFRGTVLPGEIIALVSYMNQTLLALVVAANLIVLFTRAVASTRRVAEVLDTQPAITDGPGAQPKEDAPAIEFENVDFFYHEGAEKALENISFYVLKGQTIGIIGGTGSGKTTIVNLIMRNFDIASGAILVKGINVKQYTLHQLRRQIGLVPQAAAIFSGTVRENLRISKESATDEELWQALETAQA
ncbi:MAG: ABC transporter ATP-binding protein, partial [Oscillospiraceae bacterium]